MTNTGLNNLDIKKIQSVFHLHPEIEKAILFGSRAKGNYKAASNIDLSLVGTTLTLSIQQEIENELDDLLLPYKFDISIYHTISSTELLDHINRMGKLFFQKEKTNS
jgi:predicted nucleotidyltransferase